MSVFLGVLSVEQLLAFNSLLAYFLDPIENLINLQSQLQTAIVAAERLGEILDLELEESMDENKKINPYTLNGEIEFKNVDFRYGTRQLILEGLNLTIDPGEKIALVGESSSGKTTLSKLILNF
jgi:ABC-type bacteriocin/lantibiotic exporter with double-glycine peptidase domain